MALKIKKNIVVEDILDENGKKIGEIKFNPNDTHITSKLAKIVENLTLSMTKIKDLKIKKISVDNISSYEEFENLQKEIENICIGFKTEDEAVENVIKELIDIFGKETINLITGGTNDTDNIIALLDVVMPYVKEARKNDIDKYMPKNSDVLE